MDRAVYIVVGVVITWASWVIEPSRAGTIRSDVALSEYQALAASNPAFDAVGQFRWREGNSAFNGSGVLISEDWVLTAAHVVAGTDLQGGGVSRMTFELDGRVHTAAEWIPHPDWSDTSGTLSAGVDIGLVRLARPVDTPPVTLYSGDDEQGRTGTIVGFGNQGNGTTGYRSNSAGERLAGQNVIDSVRRSFRARNPLMFVDFDNPNNRRDSTLGSRNPLPLEYLAAPGDSGGGVFIDIDGEQQLAGIVSYISSFDSESDSDYGDQAGLTRVSSFLDWIDSIVGPLNTEPLLGDFNGDGQLTIADLDQLVSELVNKETNRSRDLNNDRFLDIQDSIYWLENLMGTVVGDVNLDGRFDSTDFVNIFQTGEYEDQVRGNSRWSTGDWNADGDFDSADLVFALQVSQFDRELGTARAMAVPEPVGLLSVAFAGLIAARSQRVWHRT